MPSIDDLIHGWKEILDSLHSKGGGIFIAVSVFYSSFLMWMFSVYVGSEMSELKQVSIFAAGTLVGLAGGDRLANGNSKTTTNTTSTVQTATTSPPLPPTA